jgi:AGCS family alanine or glycine:cation symporter
MYYLKDGLGKHYGKKWLSPVAGVLAFLFSCFAILASFGIGNMAQINKIVLNMDAAFFTNVSLGTIPGTDISIIHLIIGVALLVIAALIIIGGLRRIAKFAEIVVPFMAVIYVIGSLVILAFNIQQIGPMFAAIFKFAFKPAAFLGGGIGVLIQKTMTQGFKRGVFSNEAGLGSAPIAHAATSETDPVKQGLYGIFEVFMDTIVICTLTALTVLCGVESGGVSITWGQSAGTEVIGAAFSTVFGAQIGSGLVAVGICLFALSTILSWSLYGTRCCEFLFGAKVTLVYQIIFVCVVVIGATLDLELVWNIADTLNGFMAIPNLIALLGLSGVVVKLTKDYFAKK